jgi:hypothetical protein
MGKLADFTIDQGAGSLALVLGSIGGLCLILFKSRCETITICWGLWSCNRKVMTEEELEKAEKDKKEAEKVSLVKPTISASEPESAV